MTRFCCRGGGWFGDCDGIVCHFVYGVGVGVGYVVVFGAVVVSNMPEIREALALLKRQLSLMG